MGNAVARVGAWWSPVASTCTVALGLLGCHEYGAHPVCPAQGGNPWHETDSPHFHVVSDLDPEESAKIARELEVSLSALEQVAFKNARVAIEPSTVVVFEDLSDFHAFFPRNMRGLFVDGLPADAEPSRVLVLAGELTKRSRSDFLHELTHDLFARNFGAAPPWLNEGFAGYYSTLEVNGATVRLGAPLPRITYTDEADYFMGTTTEGEEVLAVPIDVVVRPSRLLSLGHEQFYVDAGEDDQAAIRRGFELYLGSWAFLHMLMDGPSPYPAHFDTFLRARIAGTPLHTAWEQTFADIAWEQMDRDFVRYTASREVVTFRVAFTPPAPAQVTHRQLDDAEVHLLWARLGEAWRLGNPATTARDYEEAIRRAPDRAEAYVHRGVSRLRQERPGEAATDLETALRLAPDDPRVLFANVVLRLNRSKDAHVPPSLGDLEPRLAKVATSGLEFAALSQMAALRGDVATALAYGGGAVSLSPVEPPVLDSYASVLAAAGRARDAATLQEKAIAFLPDGADARPFRKRLAEYRAKAAESAAP